MKSNLTMLLLPCVLLVLSLLPASERRAPSGRVTGASGGSGQASPVLHSGPGFEKNLGQSGINADFLYRDRGMNVLLNSKGMMARFHGEASGEAGSVICMELVGSDPASMGKGAQKRRARSNYLMGNEPDQWITGVPHFGQVVYPVVYPGIDLIYYFNEGSLEFDFQVSPGSDPGRIAFAFPGADHLEVDRKGNLKILRGRDELTYHPPVAWQELESGREHVEVRFAVLDQREVRFELGSYDKRLSLTIDPKVEYATFLGGSSYDRGNGIAVDREGCVYITGSTRSLDFPMESAYEPEFGKGTTTSGLDVFISKFSADGSALVYSTYFGGWGDESPVGIVVDESGNAGIAGYTASSNRESTPEDDGLPLKNAYQTTLGGTTNQWDAFVTVFSPDGSDLVYSTFLGGKHDDEASDIALGPDGMLYVAGTTFSFDFPNKNAWIENIASYYFDAFALKLDPFKSGEESLVYATFIGGDLDDYGNGIAVDNEGSAYVTGYAKSTDFPTTENAIQTSNPEDNDAFLTRLAPDGKSAIFSTYLGGSGGDEGYAVAVDDEGSAYFYGNATDGFPGNPQPVTGPSGRVVCKILPDGSGFAYASRVMAYGRCMAVDSAGQVYIAGSLGGDVHLYGLNSEGNDTLFNYTTGGSETEFTGDIALGPAGSIYLTGSTSSLDFPVFNAYQSEYGDDVSGFVKSDAFVVKLVPGEKGALEVDPDPVVFPITLPGQTTRESVTISNPGETEVEIREIYVQPDAEFSIADLPELPVVLEQFQEIEFQITYSPAGSAKGTAEAGEGGTGTLVIVNDGDPAQLEVLMKVGGIVVNDPGDGSDYDLLDGICDADPDQPGNQCTLRAAIENVNAIQSSQVTFVYFRIPEDLGNEIIPASKLPPILYPIHFDVPDTGDPILLNGESAGNSSGLEFRSGYCYLENFIVAKWKGDGVLISGGEWNIIDKCIIRQNSTGDNAAFAGIRIEESSSNQIRDCYIYSNEKHGIRINGETSVGNVIEECTIGYPVTGPAASRDQAKGVYLSGGMESKIRNNRIGNHGRDGIILDHAKSSYIGYNQIHKNHDIGIHLRSETLDTEIDHNLIGCDAEGMLSSPNLYGIAIYGGCSDLWIHDNLISGNTDFGIFASGYQASVEEMVIEDNLIGLDHTGRERLPNKHGITFKHQCMYNVIQNNVISGNVLDNLNFNQLGNASNEVLNNLIGTDTSGTIGIDGSKYGIDISRSSNLFISGNTISAGQYKQINIYEGETGKSQILFNQIGTDKNGNPLTNNEHIQQDGGIFCVKAYCIVAANLIGYAETGIAFHECTKGLVIDNEIFKNDLGLRIRASYMEVRMNQIYENLDGVEVVNSGDRQVVIAGNAVFDNKVGNTGIHLTDSRALIHGNSVYGDAGDGIAVEGASEITAQKNNLMDNGGMALNHLDLEGEVDARFNWWGAADGPGGAGPGTGDEVSEGVEYADWKASPVSLVVIPERDTGYMGTGYSEWFDVYFENWATLYDTIIYRVSDDRSWLTSPETDTVILINDRFRKEYIKLIAPTGTEPGTESHVEIVATSSDGHSDTARFVAMIRSYDPVAVYIRQDSVLLAPGDSFHFSVFGVNGEYTTVWVDESWTCTGGTIDDEGIYVAGSDTGTYVVTVTDSRTGLWARSTVMIRGWATSIEEIDAPAASSAPELWQNYPNPFSDQTQIGYVLAKPSRVVLSVYDVLGRRVATLVDRVEVPGTYEVSWNGTAQGNRKLGSGIYIYRLETAFGTRSRKLYLTR